MNAEKLSITLPADMAQAVRGFVSDGSYASNSEVIRDALRLWLLREEEQQARLEQIRAKIVEAVNDPVRYTAEEVEAHFEKLHARILKEYGKDD